MNVATRSGYNILSVCAGVGGLDLGVGLAVRNARTVCYIEREIQAAAILVARMQDKTLHAAPIWSDMLTFDGKPWRGHVDCIISGDPCQPNSVAGKRGGANDDRFLIDGLIRLVKDVRPSRLFRENVPGNADGQLAALVPALEDMGYRVAAGIFSAGEVGASHRRERLFIMADAQSFERDMGTPERWFEKTDFARASEDVAYTKSHSARSVERRIKPSKSGPCNDSRFLPDPSRARSQGKQRIINNSKGRQKPYEPPGFCGGTIFAPGPNDPRWGDILVDSPTLAPALSQMDLIQTAYMPATFEVGAAVTDAEAQSRFCRMVDGLAHRTDRLRASGNGVCAMAAAVAWLSLSAHFEGG